MLRADELDKLGFDLGWDFAVYGITPNSNALPSILEGYEYGSQQKSRRHADIFIRKYLYLRYSALNRGRAVSEYVSPQLISYLCVRKCPITKSVLTARTCLDTDWSIDRVNNNGAYAPGNMVVMGVKANRSKGNKSSDDILDIVRFLEESKEAEYDSLTLSEWKRLSWLAEKCDKERRVPLVMKPPPLIMMSSFDAMQLSCALAANRNEAFRIKRICNPAQTKLFMKFVKSFSKHCLHDIPISYMLETYQVPTIFAKFCDFYDSLGNSAVDKCSSLVEVIYEPIKDDIGFLRNTLRKLWLLDTNGYISDTCNPLSDEEARKFEKFLKKELGEPTVGDSFDPFALL